MIDLTPLDVRNKRGDFKKIMRGYDPEQVDLFLEAVAERLEGLVRETIQLRERTQTLQQQVEAQAEREQAVQDALVTAQGIRADMQAQSQREADHVLREAEVEARRMLAEADEEVRKRLRGIERRLDQGQDALEDLERRRARFIKEFRNLLERELDVVVVEEGRAPLETRAIDLDLGAPRASSRGIVSAASTVSEPAPAVAPPGEDEAPETRPDAASGMPASIPPEPAHEPPESASIPLEPAPAPPEPASTAPAPEAPVVDDEPPTSPSTPPVAASEVIGAPALDPEHPGNTPAADRPTGAAAPPVSDLTPAVEVSPPPPPAPAPEAKAAPTVTASRPAADSDPSVQTVDVTDLRPSSGDDGSLPAEPSTLELELMAGAEQAGAERAGAERERFPDVPDLETVLAEAGVEEVHPPDREIAPPPPRRANGGSERLILFDRDDDDRTR